MAATLPAAKDASHAISVTDKLFNCAIDRQLGEGFIEIFWFDSHYETESVWGTRYYPAQSLELFSLLHLRLSAAIDSLKLATLHRWCNNSEQ